MPMTPIQAITNALATARSGFDGGGDTSKASRLAVVQDPTPASSAGPAQADAPSGSAPASTATSPPSLSDQIGQAYQDVLGRSGDAPGMQWWNDQITSGKSSLNNLYSDLLNSDEFNSNLKTAGYNGEGVTASTPIDTGPNGGVITSNDQQGPKPAYLADFNYSDYGDPLSARYAYLSQALNPTIAAALMGNWQIESGNNPTQMQTVGGLDSAPRNLTSSGLPMGFGSAQWGGTRLQNDSGDPNKMGLLDFTKQYGYDPNSTEGQDRFSVYELTTNPEYAKTYAAAQKAGNNLDSVTRILGAKWEAPDDLSATLGDRQSSADMYFNKYGPGGNFDPADQTEINQTLARIQDPAFNKQYAGPTIQEYMAAAQNNIGNNGPATATADATPTDTGSLTQPASVVDGNTILGNGTTDAVNGTANAGLNANPVLGNNGLMTDNTPIQTNSTNITGTNIIPWQNGLDPSLGSSSNGIPFGFGTTSIDTGANPLGSYSIDPSGGLGSNGFDFNMFNKGGAVSNALRVAKAAGGLAEQSPILSGERPIDRMNRMLSVRQKSGEFEDRQSNMYNYLQDHPGPQIRDNSFADGGGADGGGSDYLPPDDASSSSSNGISWGDPDNPADFVRASDALLARQKAAPAPSSSPAIPVPVPQSDVAASPTAKDVPLPPVRDPSDPITPISSPASSGNTGPASHDRAIPPANIPNLPHAKGVDPRLVNIMNAAGQNLPDGWSWQITPHGGFRQGDPRFHGKGMAIDVQLTDPDGNSIPNYQNAQAFRMYEQFAQNARQAQMNLHPELNDKFRWGGYFSGPVGKYGAKDMMHFDLGASPKLGMAGGSWKTGLYPNERKYLPGVQSIGMGQDQNTGGFYSGGSVLSKALAASSKNGPNAGKLAVNLARSIGDARNRSKTDV